MFHRARTGAKRWISGHPKKPSLRKWTKPQGIPAGSAEPLLRFLVMFMSRFDQRDQDINVKQMFSGQDSSASNFFTISAVIVLPVGGNMGSPLALRKISGSLDGGACALRMSSLIAALRLIPRADA